MPRLILASKSPRRIKLLKQLGFEFEVSPSQIDERPDLDLPPGEMVMKLARQKAEFVAAGRSDAIVIAADTVVIKSGKLFGQPDDKSTAAEMLRELSGSSHEVYTGVTILCTDAATNRVNHVQFHERTKVTFSSLSEQEIDAYVNSGSPLDKAGAYGIQDDWGSVFVSGIEGDYYNVVGFPVNKFYQHMKRIAPEMIENIQASHDQKN